MSVYDRIAKLFRGNGSPPVQLDTPVLMGIMEYRGNLALCAPDSEIKGFTIKLVTVPYSFVQRETAASREYSEVQSILAELPKSLRPRRRFPRSSEAPTAPLHPRSTEVVSDEDKTSTSRSSLSRESAE